MSLSFDTLVVRYAVNEQVRIASHLLMALKVPVVVLAEAGVFERPIDKTIVLEGKTYRYVEKNGRVAALSVSFQLAVTNLGWQEAKTKFKSHCGGNAKVYEHENTLFIDPIDYMCPGNERSHLMSFDHGRMIFACEHCGRADITEYS